MADIVLAECDGRAWLVGGEQYIDDLLANTLDPHVSIELVACQSQTDVNSLWVQLCGPQDDNAQLWMIHPGVVNRVRSGKADHGVFFAQWSAKIDEDAMTVIRSAAIWAMQNPAQKVMLVRFLPPAGAPALADLANLRAGLIEAELLKLGVDAGRLGRETNDVSTIPGMGEESQRVDIVLSKD